MENPIHGRLARASRLSSVDTVNEVLLHEILYNQQSVSGSRYWDHRRDDLRRCDRNLGYPWCYSHSSSAYEVGR